MCVFFHRMPKRRGGSRKGWYDTRPRTLVDLWYPCGNASGDAIPPPEGVPLCEADFVNRTKQPHWMTCRGGSGKLINTIGGSPMHDWSAMGHKWKAIAESFWSVDKGPFQTQLWRLTAAMGGDIQANDERGNTAVLMGSTQEYRKIRACVPPPYALLIGPLNTTQDGPYWQIQCNNCTLSNCVYNVSLNHQLMVLYQPTFVMIPVNVSGEWYNDRGLQVIKEATELLLRSKRFIGLLIAGIAALVAVIAASATAAVSLSQSIQTAHQVNQLSANVTQALGTQEAIDLKVEERLNALYDTLTIIGREVQSLKLRLDLDCHADFKHICVTRKRYNSSSYPWDRVQKHLEGVWHDGNVSLDLMQLHQEILALREAPKIDTSLAEMAQSWVDGMRGQFLSATDWKHGILGVAGLAIPVVLGFLITPCILRTLMKDIKILKIGVHALHLHTRPKALEPNSLV